MTPILCASSFTRASHPLLLHVASILPTNYSSLCSLANTTSLGKPENNPESALLELGILLLEIWNLKTFESWAIEAGHPTARLQETYARRGLSIEWFKDPEDALLENYRRVVSICFFPAAFMDVNTSWEDPRFRNAYYAGIIDPLLQDLIELSKM